jgi:hypothetical protein
MGCEGLNNDWGTNRLVCRDPNSGIVKLLIRRRESLSMVAAVIGKHAKSRLHTFVHAGPQEPFALYGKFFKVIMSRIICVRTVWEMAALIVAFY